MAKASAKVVKKTVVEVTATAGTEAHLLGGLEAAATMDAVAAGMAAVVALLVAAVMVPGVVEEGLAGARVALAEAGWAVARGVRVGRRVEGGRKEVRSAPR